MVSGLAITHINTSTSIISTTNTIKFQAVVLVAERCKFTKPKPKNQHPEMVRSFRNNITTQHELHSKGRVAEDAAMYRHDQWILEWVIIILG